MCLPLNEKPEVLDIEKPIRIRGEASDRVVQVLGSFKLGNLDRHVVAEPGTPDLYWVVDGFGGFQAALASSIRRSVENYEPKPLAPEVELGGRRYPAKVIGFSSPGVILAVWERLPLSAACGKFDAHSRRLEFDGFGSLVPSGSKYAGATLHLPEGFVVPEISY